MTEPGARNVDPGELRRFEAVAARWWDEAGEMGALHRINPLRAAYIAARAPLAGQRVADVGCGGGILAESLDALGARVTAIDASAPAVAVARLHQRESGSGVDYRLSTAEELAAAEPGAFDVVTCMELLEHVPDPVSVVEACARLVQPGGHVFFSTLNRNPRAYLLAIIGAEYVLGLLPRGTHDYARFIRPSELDAWARRHGLVLAETTGMSYNPLTRRYRLGADLGVNYLAWMRAPDEHA